MGGLSHPAVVEGGLGSRRWHPKHKQHILINPLAHVNGYKISSDFFGVC